MLSGNLSKLAIKSDNIQSMQKCSGLEYTVHHYTNEAHWCNEVLPLHHYIDGFIVI